MNLTGITLGSYRLLSPLSAGLYKAYQASQERLVAVKVLSAYWLRDETFLDRFQQQAHHLARLNHPHLLPLTDFGQEGNLAYLVTPYVEGGSLRRLVGRPLPPARAGELLSPVAAALDYTHQQGFRHGDLKPGNILLERGEKALLTGLALAGLLDSRAISGRLGINHPAYISPEQGEGEELDARSDIYALGVILYELVTGRTPFQAETPLGMVIQHLSAPLPLPTSFNPDLPASVEQVILKALAKNKADRYVSAGAMMAAFQQAMATTLPPARRDFDELSRAELADPARPPRPQAAVLGLLCSHCYHFNRPSVTFCEQCGLPLGYIEPTCARCGQTNRLGVTFCERCGRSLAQNGPACPRCNRPNRPGVSFCERCGASLTGKIQPQPAEDGR